MSEFTYQTFYWLNEVSRLPYSKRAAILDELERITEEELGIKVCKAQYPLVLTAARIRRAWEATEIPLPVADNPVSAAMLADAP